MTTRVRLEADENVQSAGEPGDAVCLRRALGGGARRAGIAASPARRLLVFRRLGRVVNYGVFARAQSASYATLSLRAVQDRPTMEANAFLGASLGGGRA